MRVLFFSSLRLLFILLSTILITPSAVVAWGGSVHKYLCPAELTGGCVIADSLEFKKSYPLASTWHLCLDNKPDCPPRLLAKYYVKKYFLEGKEDKNLQEAAAHLIQDANVPDHWFPMRDFFGRIFVPFAPKWVSKTENEVDQMLVSNQVNWTLFRKYHGKMLEINQAYLDNIKTEVVQFINQEPPEDLGVLEKQVKWKDFWQKVRSYREWIWIWLIILTPILIYQIWKWQKSRTGKLDLLIEISILIIFLIGLSLGYLY